MTDNAAATDAAVPQRPTAPNVGLLVERAAIPLLLVLLVAYFSLNATTGEIFRSAANIQNVLANQSVTGLIALGMIVPLIAGYFDLSVAAIAGAANVTMAALLTSQHNVVVSVIGALIVATLLGALNGVLVAVARLNPFIITLGTYILIGGLLQLYTHGKVISNGFPIELSLWGSGQWLGVARPFWLLMFVAFLVWVLLTQTTFGRRLAAIGSNENAARLAGIRVDAALFYSFLLSGLLAGVAGCMLTIRMSSGDATTALSYLFSSLAAVFLGLTAVNPGHYNVWGTMFGVFLVATAVSGLILMGADAWVTQVFNGTALVLSVTVSTLLARSRDRRARLAQLAAMHSAS
jgi:ribose transport system permease protein